jgi:hypothetical protein
MDDALEKLREICLALPDVTEGMAWGHPVLRAGEAMFCGHEEVRGKWCVNVSSKNRTPISCVTIRASSPRSISAESAGFRWRRRRSRIRARSPI